MKDKRLEYNSLLDFYPRRTIIKKIFDSLELEERCIYKMYVYSLPFEEDRIKDLIWEYLNEWGLSKFELASAYRIKKERLEKRKRIEICNNEKNEQLERHNKSQPSKQILCQQEKTRRNGRNRKIHKYSTNKKISHKNSV